MEIRKLTLDEAPELARMFSTVYTHSSDLEVSEALREECGFARGAFEKGRLRSTMLSIPFHMMLDGRPVPVAGIGGVGTFPEDRRQGYVRMLYDRVFEDMRERGQAVFHAVPFLFPLLSSLRLRARVLPRGMRVPPLGDRSVEPEGGMEEVSRSDPSQAAEVYQAFAAGRNLAIVRDERLWKRRLKEKPCKDQVYTYLCRNQEGKPSSFFQFKVEPRGEHHFNLICLDLAWTGSLAAALSWLSVFSPRAERAVLHLPSDSRPEILFAEQYRLTQRVSATYMARRGGRRACPGIDPWARRFRRRHFGERRLLEMEQRRVRGLRDERGEAHVSPSRKKPGIALDVRTLVQLAVGFLDGAEALGSGLLETDLAPIELLRLFPGKPLYQNDYF